MVLPLPAKLQDPKADWGGGNGSCVDTRQEAQGSRVLGDQAMRYVGSVQLSLPAISQVMGCHFLQFGWLGLLALPGHKGSFDLVEHLPMARPQVVTNPRHAPNGWLAVDKRISLLIIAILIENS